MRLGFGLTPHKNKHFEGSCELLSKQCDVMSIIMISILHLFPVTSIRTFILELYMSIWI